MKKLILLVALLTLLAVYAKQQFAHEPENQEQQPSTENVTTKEQSSTAETQPTKSDVKYEIPAKLTDRSEQIVEHTGYTLSYNKDHNTPNWSAWHLTKAHTDGTQTRSQKFWADESIPRVYRVDYYDYKGSEYDRGHMCPAADMKWSAQAMHDCFYMSNMCPQNHELNSGSWGKLENACRTWAQQEGSIYIVSGPVYKGKKHEKIGIDHVIEVPEGFFKAVLSLRKGHEKAVAFYFDNNEKKQNYRKLATSVDEIEKLTGIDLFPALDDALESRLEAKAGDFSVK